MKEQKLWNCIIR